MKKAVTMFRLFAGQPFGQAILSLIALLAIGLISMTHSASAEAREKLGYGLLLTNDTLGDYQDRWQTGSITASRIWGPSWMGELPTQAGAILELRSHGRVIAPSNLVYFNPNDRRYAGILSFGLHTHFQRGGADIALGTDLVMTGAQTGVSQVQTAMHDIMGINPPSKSVLSNQIGNGFHPTFVGEVGRGYSLGSVGEVRPFAELRVGDETLGRIGFDLTFGQYGQGGLLVRDPVTGHRYEVIRGDQDGFSFLLGGDITQMESSIYLPEGTGPEMEDTRARLRAGGNFQRGNLSLFYGTSWLQEEFEGQPEGQFVGATQLKFSF